MMMIYFGLWRLPFCFIGTTKINEELMAVCVGVGSLYTYAKMEVGDDRKWPCCSCCRNHVMSEGKTSQVETFKRKTVQRLYQILEEQRVEYYQSYLIHFKQKWDRVSPTTFFDRQPPELCSISASQVQSQSFLIYFCADFILSLLYR